MALHVNIPTNCHLYHYAGNNPVKYTDPEGEFSIKEIVESIFEFLFMTQHDGIDYNPDSWNLNLNLVRNANCYAYALNFKYNPKTHAPFLAPEETLKDISLQPGELAGCPQTEYSRENIVGYMEKDMATIGMFMKKKGKDDKVRRGNWKIALFMDTDNNFHFYRKNTDGTWSRKQGRTEVTNLDSAGEPIKNPENARKSIDYRIIGYYEVGYEKY